MPTNTSSAASAARSNVPVLSTLRALMPSRRLLLSEALHIAELQAERLRTLRGYADVPVPSEILTGIPRLTVEHDDSLPTQAASGVSYWNERRRLWIIGLNPEEPRTRRRFSALHEFKHIIDHYHPGLLTTGQRRTAQYDPCEQVADYFAGCVLVPKRALRAAYFEDSIQRVSDLAELFDVSRRAIEVRLSQLGLTGGPDDPDSPSRPRLRYRRQQPWLQPPPVLELR